MLEIQARPTRRIARQIPGTGKGGGLFTFWGCRL